MKKLNFTIKEIRYATDIAIFERAKKLFEQEKLKNLEGHEHGYSAIVEGTSPYKVALSIKSIDRGHCNCYMGENDEICKHLLAVGLAVLDKTEQSLKSENLSPTSLKEVKMLVSSGMKKLKPYNGPSSIWFKYQSQLEMGSDIIKDAVVNLPADKESLVYLWKLVLKLSNKLANSGIDDSGGTVGSCVDSIVQKCINCVRDNNSLLKIAKPFVKDNTGFYFEEELEEGLKEIEEEK